jgi:2-polyprenyl-3-methyl-5-hydroxy-6-metoxy-1,4-benzoquinol methylase
MPPAPEHAWFNELAAFLGPAYLRNAFTKGTEQEIAFLVDELDLRAGMHVLDAGCGPGRHALALARRGITVTGVDLSPDFIELARAAADDELLPIRFDVMDVRALTFDHAFDAVLCLCQGGFGLLGGGADEEAVMDRFAAALKPGGRLALSAFSSAFVLRHLEPGETFDLDRGVNHERAVLKNADGSERTFDLWTTCYTPRELRLLARAARLEVDAVYGVTPGRYARTAPNLDAPEHLLIAHRPASA